MMNSSKGSKKLRLLGILLIAVLTITMSSGAMVLAKSSINDNTNKPYVPGSGEWTVDGFDYMETYEGVIAVDPDTTSYDNKKVSDIVTDVNGGKNTSIQDIIDKIPQPEGKTDAKAFPTTKDFDVNLEMYDRLTDFMDVKYRKDGVNHDIDPGEVKILVPEAVGMRGSDLMVLVIDSKTGEMFLVPPNSFDSILGLLTFDMPCDGPACVLRRVPIVVRNVDPDRYPNKELAEIIRNLPDNEVLGCEEFLKATEADPYDTLEIADGVTVNTADYSSAIALSDVAVELSRTDFSYDLSAKFRANLYRGNDKVDWERILNYAGVKYDKQDIKADDRALTEFEPVKLNDCFVYHIDAATRDVSIIYEPTVCWSTYGDLMAEDEQKLEKDDFLYWDVDDIDAQNVKEKKLNLDDEEETSSLFAEEVYAAESVDDTFNNDEDVCLVINGDEYLGMGPFLLFMPNEAPGFPWWILLLVALAGGGGGYAYYRKKNKNDKTEQTA